MAATGARHDRDAFPETRRTWMGRLLDQGDVAQVLHHVMEVYAEPLRIYCQGCSLRWVGEPGDLVSGFFADRLSRPAFLERWRESQRPLRFWLIVGFKHFLLEEAKRRRRDARYRPEEVLEAADGEPDRAFDRQCAVQLVRQALARTEAECLEAGLGPHWEVFAGFYLRDEPLEQTASAAGLDRARAAVMKRTVVARFRAILRELVSWNGAEEGELDAEVRSLMEVLG